MAPRRRMDGRPYGSYERDRPQRTRARRTGSCRRAAGDRVHRFPGRADTGVGPHLLSIAPQAHRSGGSLQVAGHDRSVIGSIPHSQRPMVRARARVPRAARGLVGSDDPVARALAVVGQKWTLLIVRDLISGPRRFTEIQRSLGADPKVISARLRELAAGGLVSRKAYAEVPPRVEYALTEPGRALEYVVESLRRWGSTQAIRATTSRAGSSSPPRSRAARPRRPSPRSK